MILKALFIILSIMILLLFLLMIIDILFIEEKSCYECIYSRIDAGTPAFEVRCHHKKGYHNHREICEKWRKI